MTPLERAALTLFPAGPAEGEEPSAVWYGLSVEVRAHFLAQARTVLRAIREPSEAMEDAADAVGLDLAPAMAWRAMIDAALEES